jgi:hypothetical protein
MDFIITFSDLVKMLGNALEWSSPVWAGGQIELRHVISSCTISVKRMNTC